MAPGRSTRPPQVRRRPTPTGQPRPIGSRPRGTISGRAWRPDPSRAPAPGGLPIFAKLVMGFAVVALGGAVLLAAMGMLGGAVSGIGSGLAGMIGAAPTESPAPSAVPLPDAPSFALPGTSYTSEETVDLSGSVPASVTGRTGYTVVVSGGLKGQDPVDLAEVTVGETTVFSIEKVPLRIGVNVLTARISGPAGDSPASEPIYVAVDLKPPPIAITSPDEGATVNGTTVTILGKTQGRSDLIARNETTGQSISAAAEVNGTFKIKIGIRDGKNAIVIQATDPAGNSATQTLQVTKGKGALEAKIAASARTVSKSDLPQDILFTVTVTDPNGDRLPGALVTFSVSVPGIPTLTKDVKTGSDGRATYKVTLPKGATAGGALATALVATDQYGDTSAKLTFTIAD
jgi:hypothetical protein